MKFAFLALLACANAVQIKGKQSDDEQAQFEAADKNGDGKLDFDELLDLTV